jgi:putative ATP-binding cassette transporter
MISDLQMAGEVDFEDGEFITAELSEPQRERLAILVAELEQRPVFVFDEVAASQPQHFRKHFYEVLLPRWQKQGKTMIVVTQDDQFFHVADRILKMGYGVFERARP